MKALKGITAKLLFGEHPSLRTAYSMGHLWSPRYYVGTVGHVSQETVLKSVLDQKVRAGDPSAPVPLPNELGGLLVGRFMNVGIATARVPQQF
jgi:hypothetical protein